MGFIRWLYGQYKVYKLQRLLPAKSQAEKEKEFMRNYTHCIELGFSQEQLLALLNLVSSK